MADRRYHVSRAIDAPVETVWGLLTDSSAYASWNPTIVRISGSMEEGSTVELVSTVNPKRTFTLTVVERRDPNRMVWSDGMPLGLFRGDRTYLVEPDGDGSRFSMTEEYSGPLAGLFTRMIPDLSESFEQIADGLKAGAEGVGG